MLVFDSWQNGISVHSYVLYLCDVSDIGLVASSDIPKETVDANCELCHPLIDVSVCQHFCHDVDAMSHHLIQSSMMILHKLTRFDHFVPWLVSSFTLMTAIQFCQINCVWLHERPYQGHFSPSQIFVLVCLQAILISMCLQGMVDELIMKKDGKKIKRVNRQWL